MTSAPHSQRPRLMRDRFRCVLPWDAVISAAATFEARLRGADRNAPPAHGRRWCDQYRSCSGPHRTNPPRQASPRTHFQLACARRRVEACFLRVRRDGSGPGFTLKPCSKSECRVLGSTLGHFPRLPASARPPNAGGFCPPEGFGSSNPPIARRPAAGEAFANTRRAMGWAGFFECHFEK